MRNRRRPIPRRDGSLSMHGAASTGFANSQIFGFVKTMKRDCVSWMPKRDARMALQNLTIAFDHNNESYPHSALKYRSPREFRQRVNFQPKRDRMSCRAGASPTPFARLPMPSPRMNVVSGHWHRRPEHCSDLGCRFRAVVQHRSWL